ncbi:MAG: TAXI family TRAP transporter solute-binding subunit [Chloroflexi bacterium]|nr:TAXI family TRAP transporter solute-binding subunit [Chloroflexota bacterium]
MNRLWRYTSVVSLVFVVLLVACSQASAPAAPSAAKPAEKAAVKPAEKPADKAPAAIPTAKVEAKAPAKSEAKPAAPKGLPSTVGIGTHPVGGGFYAVGTGVAKVVSDHSPIKVIVKPFAGPNAWMPMMDAGELELGILSGNDAGWAYTGGTGYDKPYKNIRVVARGNEIPVAALVVRVDSGIKSIKELRGKRVTSEYGGNVSIRENVIAMLESVGLGWNDVKQVPVSDYVSGLKAVREGRADAAFAGSTTLAATLETDSAVPLHLLNFGDIPPEQAGNPPKDVVEKLRKRQPGAMIYRQKKEGFLKSDAASFSYPTMLAASAKLNADVVYAITKAVFENDKELWPVHEWAQGWKQATMFNPDPPTPYHDGAIRFWKEKGLWTPAAEANQKKLLGQ